MPVENYNLVKDGTIQTAFSTCESFNSAAKDRDVNQGRRLETIAFVKEVEGEPIVVRQTANGQEQIPMEVGMDLYANDKIINSAGQSWEAIFADSSTVTSNIEGCTPINQHAHSPEEGKRNFRESLERGVVSVPAGEVAEVKGDTMLVKVRNDTNIGVTG